MKGTLANRQTP